MDFLKNAIDFFRKKELHSKVVDVLILSRISNDPHKRVHYASDNCPVQYRVVDGISFEMDEILMQMEQLLVEKDLLIKQLQEKTSGQEDKLYGISNLLHNNNHEYHAREQNLQRQIKLLEVKLKASAVSEKAALASSANKLNQTNDLLQSSIKKQTAAALGLKKEMEELNKVLVKKEKTITYLTAEKNKVDASLAAMEKMQQESNKLFGSLKLQVSGWEKQKYYYINLLHSTQSNSKNQIDKLKKKIVELEEKIKLNAAGKHQITDNSIYPTEEESMSDLIDEGVPDYIMLNKKIAVLKNSLSLKEKNIFLQNEMILHYQSEIKKLEETIELNKIFFTNNQSHI